jgi:hypothetical protein
MAPLAGATVAKRIWLEAWLSSWEHLSMLNNAHHNPETIANDLALSKRLAAELEALGCEGLYEVQPAPRAQFVTSYVRKTNLVTGEVWYVWETKEIA